jgi:hypothetical protein
MQLTAENSRSTEANRRAQCEEIRMRSMRRGLETWQGRDAVLPAGHRPLPRGLHRELIGEPPSAAAKKRGPTPKIQQQMERIQRLPKAQQRFVMQMIDTVLAQQGR